MSAPDLEKYSPYAVVDTMGSFNVMHTPSGRHVIDRAFCVLLCTELNEAYAAGMKAGREIGETDQC